MDMKIPSYPKKRARKSIDEKPISFYKRFIGKFEYLPQKNIFVEIRGVSRASRGIGYFWVHGKGIKKGLSFHVEQFSCWKLSREGKLGEMGSTLKVDQIALKTIFPCFPL